MQLNGFLAFLNKKHVLNWELKLVGLRNTNFQIYLILHYNQMFVFSLLAMLRITVILMGISPAKAWNATDGVPYLTILY